MTSEWEKTRLHIPRAMSALAELQHDASSAQLAALAPLEAALVETSTPETSNALSDTVDDLYDTALDVNHTLTDEEFETEFEETVLSELNATREKLADASQ